MTAPRMAPAHPARTPIALLAEWEAEGAALELEAFLEAEEEVAGEGVGAGVLDAGAGVGPARGAVAWPLIWD